MHILTSYANSELNKHPIVRGVSIRSSVACRGQILYVIGLKNYWSLGRFSESSDQFSTFCVCAWWTDLQTVCDYHSQTTVNVLKFRTQFASQTGLDNQCRPRSDFIWRSSLIRVFPVSYLDKHFVNLSPDNPKFLWKQKVKSVRNFWTFTVHKL